MKWIAVLCLGGLALSLHSCADREDALHSELSLVGQWTDTYGEVADLAAGSTMLYVAANERAGVLSFRLADEAAPFPAGGATGLDSLYAPGDAEYISTFLLDDRILFCKLATNLLAFGLDDPMQPRYIRNFFASGVNDIEAFVENGLAYLYFNDRSDGLSLHAFAADTSGLAADDPARWFMTGDNPPGELVDTHFAAENDGNDLRVIGDLVFLADGRYGLKIFRHVGPRLPMQLEQIAMLRLPGDAIRIAVEDGLAAIALGGEGLALVDVGDPSRPYLRSVYEPGGTTLDVELGNGHAYLANSSRGVLVLDVTQPDRPTASYQFDTGYARRLRIGQGRIYVADRELGLLILQDPLGN